MAFIVSNDTKTLKKYVEDGILDIVIPGTFSAIGKEAFYESDIRSVIIEEGVEKIDSSAFCGCYKLERITLPNSLETIGYDAFGHCEKLKELLIPEKTKKLGKAPFANCRFKIIISENNDSFKVLDEKLFSKDGKKLIYSPTDHKEKSYTVPSGTQTICELAFAWNDQIEEIILPEGVKEIKGGAFGSCKSLEKIVIPATVKKIDLEFDIISTFDAMDPWCLYPKKRETFIIEAPKDSYAIEFAKEHNIKFNEI